MSGGGGGDTETTSVPWEGVQPGLRFGFREARNLYDQGNLVGLGDQSQNTLDAQAMMADMARAGGSGLTPQAQGLAGQTLAGDFLTGETNPYMQDAISYAQQPVIDAWREQIAPSIDASFGSTAGGLGSGAYAAARNRSEDTLARNLAGAATQAGMQNYATERGRQLQTMMGAPGLNQAGYGDLAQLGRVGAAQDARAQMEAGMSGANLGEYMRLLQGGLNFGTTTSQQDSSINPFSTALGLGTMGLSFL